MKIWHAFMGSKVTKNKANAQREYRILLAKKLNNRNFATLSEKEKREVLEVAAKDFSSKFSKDIAILAKE
jgi:ABC-type molybdenum transport system ATPase subunit/photorepair protein PhrA